MVGKGTEGPGRGSEGQDLEGPEEGLREGLRRLRVLGWRMRMQECGSEHPGRSLKVMEGTVRVERGFWGQGAGGPGG